MASNSHQRSGSSETSRPRKRVVLGQESARRVANPHPEVDAKPKAGKGSTQARGTAQKRKPKAKADAGRQGGRARDTRLPPHISAKKAERERRKVARQRAAVKRAIIAVALVAVVAVSWVGLRTSALFTIEQTRVEGVRELSEQEVIAVAAVEEGATLLSIDEDAVIERLTQVPWVARVDVVRLFPSTLLISVEERERFAMVDAGATFWSVDSAGRVLGESLPDTSTPLPVIRDVVTFEPVAGEITDSEAVKNAIAVLKGISPELLEMTAVVSAPSAQETALLTEGNVEVMLGRADQLTEKSALALEIMREQGSGVVFIDVRSLERPISRGLTD